VAGTRSAAALAPPSSPTHKESPWPGARAPGARGPDQGHDRPVRAPRRPGRAAGRGSRRRRDVLRVAPGPHERDRAEIEKRFGALRANGVPFKREDIYQHYLGENIDKEVERRTKKRDEQVKRAANPARPLAPAELGGTAGGNFGRAHDSEGSQSIENASKV
jgi:hypothetical protein